ncbi:MAG: hypothetical protein GY873_08770 [Bosea sp.]|uniref:phage tail tube protein n=1 Tax=Bosea sp. (in: a-proteobacteria) TaxID=1871050 RepID=UPI00239B2DBD|nr:hypothetical protein [Bosea sp. (in: a-proteobacteria)]MCP4734271.1 hypothetical protein [Bosea sp. (in: a-proteobacteria)]
MTQVLGIVDIIWRGQNIPVEKGAKLTLGGIVNTAVVYGRKVGRAQSFEASEVEAVTALERGQKFKERYGNPGEGELQVQCDTGQTFTWPDAFLVDRREMTGGEGGKVPLKWNAGEPEEITA